MTVYVRKNESFEDAISRFKYKVRKDGILDEFRSKTAFKSDSERRRDKARERNKKRIRKQK